MSSESTRDIDDTKHVSSVLNLYDNCFDNCYKHSDLYNAVIYVAKKVRDICMYGEIKGN